MQDKAKSYTTQIKDEKIAKLYEQIKLISAGIVGSLITFVVFIWFLHQVSVLQQILNG